MNLKFSLFFNHLNIAKTKLNCTIIQVCFFSFFCFSSFATTIDSASQLVQSSQREAKNSQKKINKLDDETVNLLDSYRITIKKTDNLRIYNEQLSNYIKGQKEEIFETRKKIEEVKDTGKEIVPLMLRMLESLKIFVELDMPFLITQRKKRIQELQKVLSRSDVSVSEKYRRLITTYKTEQEYGRTLQTYREIKKIKDKEITVDYIRLGRIALFYKSLDGKHLAYWDQKEKTWKKLSRSYKKPLTKAIKMALKQIPPDLIKLPIPSPKNKEPVK